MTDTDLHSDRNARIFAVGFAIAIGILIYFREWLTLTHAIPFPEQDFFQGFPNLLSPVPGVLMVLGFIFRDHPVLIWAAFFIPSLIVHNAIMLSFGFFDMWPAFAVAHTLLVFSMLPVAIVGAWAGKKYLKIKSGKK